jgi:hypothetical protein
MSNYTSSFPRRKSLSEKDLQRVADCEDPEAQMGDFQVKPASGSSQAESASAQGAGWENKADFFLRRLA